jgi:hypothetical protein
MGVFRECHAHRGILTTCYGETNHFVSSVREIEEVGVHTIRSAANPAINPRMTSARLLRH